MRRAIAGLMLLWSGTACSSFEPGGLLDATPRSVALAGADIALPDVPAAAAHLPRFAGPRLAAGYGIASGGGQSAFQVDASGTWEGVGFGGALRRRAIAGASERTIGIGLGLPIEEVPGLSFGITLQSLGTDLIADAASGLTAEVSVTGPLPSPVPDWTLHAGASVDPLFGSLDWDSGLEETLARQSRLGLAGRWRDRLTGYAELRLIRGPVQREGIWALAAEYRIAVTPHPAVGELDLAPRVGFRSGTERSGTATAGLGVGRGAVRVEYAVAANTPGQGTVHAVGAGWRLDAADPGAVRSAGPAKPVTGGDAGAAVPESAMARFDTPYRTIQIAIAPPRGFVVETWAVLVLDRRGEVVWSAEGTGLPPAAVEWNGTALDGVAAPSGSYECRLATRGPGAFRSFSAGSGFTLSRPAAKRTPEPDGPGGF